MGKTSFEWDDEKDKENQTEDINHSTEEERFYCIGRVGDGIMTVRFTYRGNVIRIYGAGYWRKGRKIYEEQNKIY